MTDPLLEREKAKYDRIWRLDEYAERSPGYRMLKPALQWLGPPPGASFIDLGSGSGQAAQALHELGYNVEGFDLCEHANRVFTGKIHIGTLWDMPYMGRYDYGYCVDVMEHIPPEKVGSVLRNIRSRVRHSCFFQIARFEDHFGDEEHGQLHICLRDPDWWAKSFRRAGWVRSEFLISEKYLTVRAMQ